MISELYLSFVLASTILIIIPGPTVLTIVSDAIDHGSQKSLITITGAALAHITYISITAFGINQILLLSVDYLVIIKWIGVAYLVMAGLIKMLKTDRAYTTKTTKSKSPLMLRGFLVTISNPKTIVFYASFFPPFLNPHHSILNQYVVLGGSFIFIFFLISFLTASSADQIIGNLQGRYQNRIDRISGALLIGAGVILSTIKSK